jgi:hypothetical protein
MCRLRSNSTTSVECVYQLRLAIAKVGGTRLTLILHPPIMSIASSIPPIPPQEAGIGAIAILVLVGAIDIPMSMDMIA